ncbi:MAG: hypothetical protein H7A25_07860 [Leptospiraceae bacterium]|nr:hypothetical protein [Leptospiraceae bacterium]MCP5499800.1 hypothetical protein [Leptospiraceae bacterium]
MTETIPDKEYQPNKELRKLLNKKNQKVFYLDYWRKPCYCSTCMKDKQVSLKKEKKQDNCNKENYYLMIVQKPKVFSYTGPVWHHLEKTTKPGEYLKIKGDWILYEYRDFVEIFHRARVAYKKVQYEEYKGTNLTHTEFPRRNIWYGSGVEDEVFIERI